MDMRAANRPTCVYRHVCNGEIIYVGSGNRHRAYEYHSGRTRYEAANNRPHEVEILVLVRHRQEAVTFETFLIQRYKPKGNVLKKAC